METPPIKQCFGYTPDYLRKTELLDGGWYAGKCRNAFFAQWDSAQNCFFHLRLKFSRLFKEKINHPEDDDGFDLFFPTAILKIEGDILKDLRPTREPKQPPRSAS